MVHDYMYIIKNALFIIDEGIKTVECIIMFYNKNVYYIILTTSRLSTDMLVFILQNLWNIMYNYAVYYDKVILQGIFMTFILFLIFAT